MDIYRGASIVFSFEVESAVLTKRLMIEDRVTVSVGFDTYKQFNINDHILVYGQKYYMLAPPDIVRDSVYAFKYTLVFSGKMHRLENVAFMLDNNPDFFLNDKVSKCMTLMNTNIRRVYGAVTGIGAATAVVNNTIKNIRFSNLNCLQAMQLICSTYELEFEFYIPNPSYELFVRVVGQTGSDLTANSYGYKTGIKRAALKYTDASELVTRLYIVGSERNIDFASYGSKRLYIPGVPYVESNVATHGIKEKAIVFEDIYPRRTGTISSVVAAGANYKFRDTAMNFDLNSYLMSQPAKLTFTGGNLSGYEFEILSYNNSIKEFEIKPYTDDQDFTVPNATFKMTAGDTYVLHDIKLPATYITAAQNELQAKATSKITEISQIRYEYDLEMDHKYLRDNDRDFDIGDSIHLYSPIEPGPAGVFRIFALTNDLNSLYNYKLTVAIRQSSSYLQRIDDKASKGLTAVSLERQARLLDKFRGF